MSPSVWRNTQKSINKLVWDRNDIKNVSNTAESEYLYLKRPHKKKESCILANEGKVHRK
jgi:hypothetical protein